MKNKSLLALGIPLAVIAISILAYLSQPEPPQGAGPREDASGANPGGASADEEEAAAHPARPGPKLTEAEALLQSYADSEAERQKELAAERQSGYVAPPLVLLDVDPAIGLNEEQVRRVEALRQGFVRGLEKLGKDPGSTEYLEYWTAERTRLDEALHLHLGDDLFHKYSSMGKVAMDVARKSASR